MEDTGIFKTTPTQSKNVHIFSNKDIKISEISFCKQEFLVSIFWKVSWLTMWIDKLYVTQQSISFNNYLFSWKIRSPDGTPDFEIKDSLANIWCPRDRGAVLVSLKHWFKGFLYYLYLNKILFTPCDKLLEVFTYLFWFG